MLNHIKKQTEVQQKQPEQNQYIESGRHQQRPQKLDADQRKQHPAQRRANSPPPLLHRTSPPSFFFPPQLAILMFMRRTNMDMLKAESLFVKPIRKY
jgi:hypothetical protein